jgi:hypothetical protein
MRGTIEYRTQHFTQPRHEFGNLFRWLLRQPPVKGPMVHEILLAPEFTEEELAIIHQNDLSDLSFYTRFWHPRFFVSQEDFATSWRNQNLTVGELVKAHTKGTPEHVQFCNTKQQALKVQEQVINRCFVLVEHLGTGEPEIRRAEFEATRA